MRARQMHVPALHFLPRALTFLSPACCMVVSSRSQATTNRACSASMRTRASSTGAFLSSSCPSICLPACLPVCHQVARPAESSHFRYGFNSHGADVVLDRMEKLRSEVGCGPRWVVLALDWRVCFCQLSNYLAATAPCARTCVCVRMCGRASVCGQQQMGLCMRKPVCPCKRACFYSCRRACFCFPSASGRCQG